MKSSFVHQLLTNPVAYELVQTVLGAKHAWRKVTRQYILPDQGTKILDLGCGPGFMAQLLPQCEYTGVDISPEYIAQARERFGDRATFHCSDVENVSIPDGSFDICIAIGLLHHIDDALAKMIFDLSYRVLKPGGRLVTADGCYVNGQSRIARWLLASDRGKYVRNCDHYASLARTRYEDPRICVHHNLYFVPTTMLVMCCEKPARQV